MNRTQGNRTNATRRTAEQIRHLKAEISELNLQGYTQSQIADLYNERHPNRPQVSQQSVSEYLQQIEAEVVQRLIPDRVVARQQQIENVRLLKRRSWDASNRHQQELKENPESRSRIETAIARNLQFQLQCLEVENKLRGLYEKYDAALTTPEVELSQFNQDEIDEFEAWNKSQPEITP